MTLTKRRQLNSRSSIGTGLLRVKSPKSPKSEKDESYLVFLIEKRCKCP